MEIESLIGTERSSNILKLPSENDCMIFFKEAREKEGIICKKCESTAHYFLLKKWQWQCKNCRFRTTLKSGTVMMHSHLSFQLWYKAIHILATEDFGISAKRLQKELSLRRYQVAWSAAHKIRHHMGTAGDIKIGKAQKTFFMKKSRVYQKGIVAGTKAKGFHFGFYSLITETFIPAKTTFSKGFLPREFHCSSSCFVLASNKFLNYVDLFWSVLKRINRRVHPKYLQNYLDFFSQKVKLNKLGNNGFEEVISLLIYKI